MKPSSCDEYAGRKRWRLFIKTILIIKDVFGVQEVGDDNTCWMGGANHQTSLEAKARSAGSGVGETWRGVPRERDGRLAG